MPLRAALGVRPLDRHAAALHNLPLQGRAVFAQLGVPPRCRLGSIQISVGVHVLGTDLLGQMLWHIDHQLPSACKGHILGLPPV